MKLKLLFFPISLVIAIILLIWFVWPEFIRSQDLQTELRQKEAVLADVEEKRRNLASLKRDLNENLDAETLVRRYLPLIPDPEHVVQTVNAIASQSGVALVYVTFPEARGRSTVRVVKDETEDALEPFNVEIQILSPYENVRPFVDNLFHGERLHDFSVISIERAEEGGQEGGDQSLLITTLAGNFYVMPEATVMADGVHPIFMQKTFDRSVISAVRSRITKETPPINIGESGRNNPFAP